MNFRIPFSGRGHVFTEEEIAVAVKAMRSANPLTQGAYQTQFQKKFSEYVSAEQSFAVNNATNGLELAAQLCQFEPGDEVIIPAHTFTSSAYPFVKAGAKVVWADIDLGTRVVSAETISRCVGPRTRALIVPHLYGFAANMPEIMAVARERNIIVVEDAAQALGVSIDGQMAGTFGDLGVYSFHSHKNMTTLGEGGMLVVNRSEWANVIPMLRHNGHCGYPQDREDYWIPAMGNVDAVELNGKSLWPNNYCLGEIECAIGTKLLERADQMNKEKRDRAMIFIDALSDYTELVFHRESSTRHNYHLLVAHVQNGLRDEFMRRMAYHHGIQCVVQYYPLNRYPLYQKLGLGNADVPITDEFFDNMVSFPFNHLLTDDQITDIITSARETLDHLRHA